MPTLAAKCRVVSLVSTADCSLVQRLSDCFVQYATAHTILQTFFLESSVMAARHKRPAGAPEFNGAVATGFLSLVLRCSLQPARGFDGLSNLSTAVVQQLMCRERLVLSAGSITLYALRSPENRTTSTTQEKRFALMQS